MKVERLFHVKHHSAWTGGRKSRVIQNTLTYALPNLVIIDSANSPGSEKSKMSELRVWFALGGWGSLTHKSE